MVVVCLFLTVFHSMHEVESGHLCEYHLATRKQRSAPQKSVLNKDSTEGEKWPQYFTASPLKKQCLFVHPLDLGLAT